MMNQLPRPTSLKAPPTVARLALEDGSIFTGRGFGALTDPTTGRAATTFGEVVFNTAMVGYQEALTDPSYAGQILTLTVPLVGNYGINREDFESATVQVRGLVIRELSRVRSNYRSEIDLSSWLGKAGILGIADIDTRALTRKIRATGVLRGVLTGDPNLSSVELVKRARTAPAMAGANFVESADSGVSAASMQSASPADWSNGLGRWAEGQVWQSKSEQPFRVVALDCGAKQNILRHFKERSCQIILLPYNTTADEIYRHNPDGLFVSNGPGDPAAVEETIALLKEVAGRVPTFGICLGHQLLCLALGGKTFKLKFGHRGANQPVKNLLTGRIEITSQNHGFAVEADSLTESTGCVATHRHLNDGTLAGFRHLTKPIFAVQYHPEAAPGPHDSGYLFDLFIRMMQTRKPITVDDLEALQVQVIW